MSVQSSNPVLVHSYRGDVLESFHRGVICVVDAQNNILYSEGDVTQVCYPRSAMKLFQHIPLLTSGALEELDLTDEEIAIFCGSHNGEAIHQEVANKVLHRAGLTQEALHCGPQAPTLREDLIALYKSGGQPQKIHNNCSGKHAGFLLYCHYKGYSKADYTDPAHPMQQEIMDVCAAFYEYPREQMHIGVDGCSAPIFSAPVINQAIGYKNLVNPVNFDEKTRKACNVLVNAVAKHPYLLAGKKRYCTDLVATAGDRVIGKTGADGVYCLGLRHQHIGICIKIDDGKMGPQYNVAQELLQNTGILTSDESARLAHYISEEQKNFGGMITGRIDINPAISFKF